ncbi:MAG: hydroxyacid dehydrogenase [Desulfobulbus propionicus]|nr:MAG: hydroxyacid dehydrogenase [Desulfobulbus propionicus]
MKIAIVEPLVVEKKLLKKIIAETLGEAINGVTIEHFTGRTTDEAELISRSKDADIVAIGNVPFRRNVLENCPKLKMLAIAFTGYDHVDVDYCHANNIVVTNCSGYATIATAELAIGLLLAVYRRIVLCDAATRAGKTKEGITGFELAEKTIGIIGTGAIGGHTAKLAKAFGMNVIAYSRTRYDNGLKYMELDDVLKEADVISLHVPVTDQTKGMIGARELSLMKKSAVLINVARGPVIDTDALVAALNTEQIAGCGIDVYDIEPPIPTDYPLLTAKNTVLAPHVAYATDESMIKRAKIEFANIKAFLDGKPQNVI